MELKQCHDCEQFKELSKFGKSFGGSHAKSRCKACYGRRERCQLRHDFLEAMGARCNCCGELDVRFLTLDHVDDSGGEHRKLLNEQQIYREARRDGYPPEKYQVLCFNCNLGRSANGGICPHKVGTSEMAWEYLKKGFEKPGQEFRNKEGSKAGYFKAGDVDRRKNTSEKALKAWETKRRKAAEAAQ